MDLIIGIFIVLEFSDAFSFLFFLSLIPPGDSFGDFIELGQFEGFVFGSIAFFVEEPGYFLEVLGIDIDAVCEEHVEVSMELIKQFLEGFPDRSYDMMPDGLFALIGDFNGLYGLPFPVLEVV